MSGYKTFAIWGAGVLGARIAEHLLRRKVDVIILTRPESLSNQSNQDLAARGAIIRLFDVEGRDATSGLKDIDVLISTTGTFGLPLQTLLADAALQAGVKLFVPSEFGDKSDGRTNPLFRAKRAVRKHIARIGIPSVVYENGLWTEYILYLGFDVPGGKATIKGEGEGRFPTTSIEDIADFVAYTLVELLQEKLKNSLFTIQGDFITFNGIAHSLEELTGRKFEITHIPRPTVAKQIEEGDDVAAILLEWDMGMGSDPNPPSHDVYPGFKPKSALEVLGPLVK